MTTPSKADRVAVLFGKGRLSAALTKGSRTRQGVTCRDRSALLIMAAAPLPGEQANPQGGYRAALRC